MKRSYSEQQQQHSTEEEESAVTLAANNRIIDNNNDDSYESKQKKAKYEFSSSTNAVVATEQTKIILIDLMEHSQSSSSPASQLYHNYHISSHYSSHNIDNLKFLLNKFKKKICNFDGSKFTTGEHSFSNNFEHLNTIIGLAPSNNENSEEEEFKFLYPYDVKICYNLNVLFVSGTDESKLVIYSLDSYKFIGILELDTMPTNLYIEEWDRECNHVIISGNDSNLYKYSLEECMKSKSKPLWICDKIKSPNGIISVFDKNNSNDKYRKETAILYVCDMFNESISIVSSLTGDIVGKIVLGSEKINISCPWSIGLNNLGQVIVSGLQQSSKHVIEILGMFNDPKTNQHNDWRSIKLIENEEDKLKYPFGLIIDGVSSNIIVCDSLNHRLITLKQDGTIVKVFGSKGKEFNQFSTPMGLCINKLNGQLMIADSENHRVLIYK